MLRSKLGLLGLCVLAVGMMAFSAASAQANPEWLILNSKGEVKTAEELPAGLVGEIDGASAALDTHLVKLHVEVSCTGGTLVGVSLEKEGKLTKGGKVKFTGCKTNSIDKEGKLSELPECRVKTAGLLFGEVESLKGKGQLQTTGLTKIEPETGVEFAKLEFEAGCVLPSPTTVNGTLFVEDAEAAKHLKKHLIKQGTGTALYVGAHTAEHLETKLVGSAWVFLTGAHAELLWGAVFP